MYQKFTQNESTDYCKIVEKGNISKRLNPSKETLTFIVQFACTYHVEKQLPISLSEMILN